MGIQLPNQTLTPDQIPLQKVTMVTETFTLQGLKDQINFTQSQIDLFTQQRQALVDQYNNAIVANNLAVAPIK